jgi:hypothetical protein
MRTGAIMDLDDKKMLGQWDHDLDVQVKRSFIGYVWGHVFSGAYKLEFI